MFSLLSNHSWRSRLRTAPRGFTLIELLIVIAIVAIIAVVVIFQYRSFDSHMLLRTLAYEIALTVREAQSRGIGVRGLEGSFDAPYGVFFRIGAGQSYVLFRDEDNNGRYNPTIDVPIGTYTFKEGYKIDSICVDGDCTKTVLHVTFKRPEPDAHFKSNAVSSASEASVFVESPSGLLREVTIMATGQISVE